MDEKHLQEVVPVEVHKNQFFWHILVPFLIMMGLCIAGAALLITGQTSRIPSWADVSLIWLLIPELIIGLVLLITTIGVIYGMTKLMKILPGLSSKAQGIFNQVSTSARKVLDGTTKPFFWFGQAKAVIKSIFRF
jgi:hypothetical protein